MLVNLAKNRRFLTINFFQPSRNAFFANFKRFLKTSKDDPFREFEPSQNQNFMVFEKKENFFFLILDLTKEKIL